MKWFSSFFRVFVFCCPVILYGQKIFKSKAEQLKSVNNYLEASRYYLGLYESGDRQALVEAAMSLYTSRKFEEALPVFSKADSLSLLDDGEEVFAYFECLKWMKRYEEADQLIRARSAEKITGAEILLNQEKMPLYRKLLDFKSSEVKLLGFNTQFSEISPTLYNDWLYFVSTVPSRAGTEFALINNQPYYSLYAVPVESDLNGYVSPEGSFGRPEKTIRYEKVEGVSLPDGMNQKFHDGPIYATPSGKMVFFSTNWSMEKRPEGKGLEVNLLMYYITKSGNIWSEPKPVPFNSFTYSNQHPFYDEASATLYFSSNMPGGSGEFDIWKSTFNGDVWSNPVNLGDKVNSPKDDVFPAVAPDGTLIFSSNGWAGLGGLDLFMITDARQLPVNMTAALNSERDDFGLCFRNDSLAYLSSNRPGGKGDDDIYLAKFNLNELKEYMRPPDHVVTGTVRNQVTGEPLDGVRIILSGAVSKVLITKNGVIDEKIPSSQVDSAAAEVLVRYEADGFQVRESRFPSLQTDKAALDLTEGLIPAENSALNQPGRKDREKFIVYFNFDRYSIRKDAAQVLAKVAAAMSQDGGKTKVLLIGHTDIRGSSAYNEHLADLRVQYVKKWLLQNGISPARIQIEGRGERQPALRCRQLLVREFDTDSCLSPAEHQLNRRVEIELILYRD